MGLSFHPSERYEPVSGETQHRIHRTHTDNSTQRGGGGDSEDHGMSRKPWGTVTE